MNVISRRKAGEPQAPPVADHQSRARMLLLAGFTILLTGLVATGLKGAFTPVTGAICAAGLLVTSAVFLPRVTRNIGLYLNMGLYSVFVVATLIVVFLLIRRHPVTYDATQDKLHSVSAVTQDFLSRLDRPVRLTGFFAEADRDRAGQMLREYQRFSPQVEYRIFHPFRDIAETRSYGEGVMPGDIFVETLTTDTRAVDRSVRVQGVSEEKITNAIVQVLRGEQVILYFTTGHGEPAIESDRASALLAGRSPRSDDLTWLREQLDRSHVLVRPLPLGRTNRVPSDASAVVMIGPRSDISAAEQAALKAYLAGGGRLLLCAGPVATQPNALSNLRELVTEYGITLPDTVVVLARGVEEAGGDRFTIPATSTGHRIGIGDTGAELPLTQARPVVKAEIPRPNMTVEEILKSPDGAVAIPTAEISEAVLSRRPLNLTIAPEDIRQQTMGAAITALRPGAPEDKATRIVVIGSGGFLLSTGIQQEGWLLFLNATNWLTSTADVLAIPAAAIKNTPLVLTAGQRQFIFVLVVILVPVLVALGGLGYSILRRELA